MSSGFLGDQTVVPQGIVPNPVFTDADQYQQYMATMSAGSINAATAYAQAQQQAHMQQQQYVLEQHQSQPESDVQNKSES